MGWEQRGAYQYYYRKERDGQRVKSIYVGRGEIANMISQIQSSSGVLERLSRATKSTEVLEYEKAEAVLEQTLERIQLFTHTALLAAGFHTHRRQWRRKRNAGNLEGPIRAKAEQVRTKFRALLDKTNKENPRPQDVKALANLLSGNRQLELWRDIASAGYLAELIVIENARATPAVKECWKHRLQALKKELGSEGAPILEQLLIQQATVLA